MKKIAVFFPGLGYSAERPLLYYTRKMMIGLGYEIVEMNYADRMDADITAEIRNNLMNPKTVKKAVLKYVGEAVRFCEEQFMEAGFLDGKAGTVGNSSGETEGQALAKYFNEYDRIIFVSKSIGSVVDTVFGNRHGIITDHIFFTPLEQAFQFVKDAEGLAFSGLSDTVAKADIIEGICGEHGIDFFSVAGGNHSLETGNVDTDIRNLSWIMGEVEGYITGMERSVYDHTVELRGGGTGSLRDYKGKVMLIVNTATGCGFTPQYQILEKMYEKFHNEGFEILDFPCNQFMNQAPGTSDEIYSFCTSRYAISFPQFAKIHVNGDDQSELFAYLKSRKGFRGFDMTTQDGKFLDRKLREIDPDYENNSDIKWNFTKFLVDRRGRVVSRYEPTEDIALIEEDVKRCLGN